MKFALIAAAAAFALSASAHAQSNVGASTSGNAVAAAPAMTEGEVRKVDKDQGKVTLKHGPIDDLGMPGMTMVFKAADPKLLDALKAGDKVKFAATNVNGVLTVTAIEAAK